MHKARSFFFVCAGLLCLAAAYHFGAQSATAQGSGTIAAMTVDWGATPRVYIAVTTNGDTWRSESEGAMWTFRGNVFSGPTPATRATWGEVKAKYRPEGAAKQAQDR